MRFFKLFFTPILLLTSFGLLVLSCTENKDNPDGSGITSLTISQDNLEMYVGETVTLKALISPASASEQTVLWGSTKNSVATVSDNGMVTAVAVGTTVITAKAGGKSASCNVTVSATKNDEIIATVNGYIVSNTGLDVTVIVNSSGTWTLSGSEEYIFPSMKSGSDGSSVVFKATDKPVMTGQNMSVDYVFTCGKASTSITLSRFPDLFYVYNMTSSSSCNIGESFDQDAIGASNSFNIRITHSLDYEVSFSDSWMHNNHVSTTTVSSTAYSETYQSEETIIIDANEDSPDATPDRTGYVYFKHKGNTVATIHISQVGQPKAGNIQFVDANVKEYCVRSYDTNGDGEVSFREAANVYSSFYSQTQTNTNFFGNAAEVITSFDEFEHFYHVTSIGHMAFFGSKGLKSVKLPPHLETIAYSVFSECTSLTSINLPNTLTYIGPAAFSGCTNLKDVIIPESVGQIAYLAFANCPSLKEITIPSKVTKIEQTSFANCTGLTKVVLPGTITVIEYRAFIGCTNLGSIYLSANTPPEIGENVFTLNSSGTVSTNLKIYVPQGSLDKYKADPKWSQYSANLVGYIF